MSEKNRRLTGFFLVLLFLIVGRLTVTYRDEIFYLLGSLDYLILVLVWMIPVFASFLMISSKGGIFYSLSLVVLIPLLGAVANFALGFAGVVVDFSGVGGIWPTFQAYLIPSSVAVLMGLVIGLITSRHKR